ncbi:hypothetical protein UA08_06707 [Talaromyces atroroseus]|uniref:Oxidase ustYa n=1 Tax=Talaromyces atroroseus TaxID=1441469 RepID=A0A225AAT5_TALAT|nr:hypothetical protein UA08_06707 [Talaromyces atroroseus]OKL58002.1 hypothetical protein UA08_06707 [Talaromyces atroroseus]
MAADEELQYTPLRTQENQDDDKASESHFQYDHRRKSFPWTYAVIILLAISNIVSIGLSVRQHTHAEEEEASAPANLPIPPEIGIDHKPFWWNTQYSSTNSTLQDELWDSIVWTHGMIARDRGWAQSQNWPDTMRLPGDESKGVWLLEGYHEIHCLRLIREYWKKSTTDPSFDVQPSRAAHVAHCFDALFQVILCHADATPLDVTGGTVVGNAELRKCRDWGQLRAYATENSACYKEMPGAAFEDYFGHCDDGDGIRDLRPR